MKKKINRPGLFIRYLIWLCIPIALDITLFSLTLHWFRVNNSLWQSLGILLGVCLLLTTSIVFFFLNRQICLVWVEDGRFHCKHILTGHHDCFPPEDVNSVSTTFDDRIIFFAVETDRTPHSGLIVELENTEVNQKLIRTFWNGEIKGW